MVCVESGHAARHRDTILADGAPVSALTIPNTTEGLSRGNRAPRWLRIVRCGVLSHLERRDGIRASATTKLFDFRRVG